MARIQDQVPEIVYIEHDLGQLEGYASRPAMAFPGVLADFDGWTFGELGDNTQTAVGDVVIKLAFAQFGKSDSMTPEDWRREALSYYDIEWALNKALHGWSPMDTVGHLIRTSVITENLPMGVRLRTLRYSLAFEDGDTEPEYGTMPRPEPQIR